MKRDYRSAPIDERLRATLALLQKLTLEPDDLTAQDIQAARSAGVSDQALIDALHVCGLFNVLVRIADALAFHIPPPEKMAKQGRVLLKRGYKLPGVGAQATQP